MSYYGWAPYVSVAARRKKAEKAAAKAKKSGAGLSPIEPSRGAIAKTFWGKAWCDNLERYSDYANRLPRGRSYARNGSVIDLKITEGAVLAQVMGSSLYRVAVKVTAVPVKHWQAIGTDCAGSIDSLVELLQGKLSTAVMQRICTPQTGLFPAPKEISFSCSCPDSASMCKHIAAVLYGVGARLDERPELLFSLRRVDAKDLVSQAGAGLPKAKKGMAEGKVLDTSMLADVFGLEMDLGITPTKILAPRKKPAAIRKVAAAKKLGVRKKTVVAKKLGLTKPPATSSASPRKPSASKLANTKAEVKAKTNVKAKVAIPVKKKAAKTVRTSIRSKSMS